MSCPPPEMDIAVVRRLIANNTEMEEEAQETPLLG